MTWFSDDHSIGILRSGKILISFCHTLFCLLLEGMVILIIQSSVQWRCPGTVWSFYSKCLCSQPSALFFCSAVMNSAVTRIIIKINNGGKALCSCCHPLRRCCDMVSTDYTSLIGKDSSVEIINLKMQQEIFLTRISLERLTNVWIVRCLFWRGKSTQTP